MILRNLAMSIRQHDWGAAVIEVFIVVIGILVALQADDWVRERDDRAAEVAALERLLSEAENTVTYLQAEVAYQERTNELRRRATALVDGQEDVPEQDLPFRIGINTMVMNPTLSPPRTTYDELTASGRLQLVRSDHVREQLALFYADLDYFRSFVSVRDNEAFWEGYFEHVSYAYNPESETTDIILSTYNWDSLRQDRTFVSRIIAALRGQLVTQAMRADLLRQASQVCDAIAAELRTACRPPDAGAQVDRGDAAGK
jgi:hypothetical protein